MPKKEYGIRVLYCRRCGSSLVVDGRLTSPCANCGGAVFAQDRATEWEPFSVENLSDRDRQTLRSLRIAVD